jgi:hypothetical protein
LQDKIVSEKNFWPLLERHAGLFGAREMASAEEIQKEVTYLTGGGGLPSKIYPESGKMSKDEVNADLTKFTKDRAGDEFFGNECNYANAWVTKKENKGKKERPKGAGGKGVRV